MWALYYPNQSHVRSRDLGLQKGVPYEQKFVNICSKYSFLKYNRPHRFVTKLYKIR